VPIPKRRQGGVIEDNRPFFGLGLCNAIQVIYKIPIYTSPDQFETVYTAVVAP
jgi:hypothetical protein